jgi:uncharacterized protein
VTLAVTADDVFKDGITEVIVTTVSKAGIPNAAPMGVVRKEGRFFIRMFTDTTTFKNVSDTGYLVANFTSDSRLYAISAFSDLTPEYFQFEEAMLPPRLKDAAGWAYFKCEVKDAVFMEPVLVKIARCSLPVHNRAFAAVIEATIVGTRLKFYKGDEGRKKIEECESIVKKCGTPADIEAMKKLKGFLGLI